MPYIFIICGIFSNILRLRCSGLKRLHHKMITEGKPIFPNHFRNCNKAAAVLKGGHLKTASQAPESSPWKLHQEKLDYLGGGQERFFSEGNLASTAENGLDSYKIWAQSTPCSTWKCKKLPNFTGIQDTESLAPPGIFPATQESSLLFNMLWEGAGRCILACRVGRQVKILSWLLSTKDGIHLTELS